MKDNTYVVPAYQFYVLKVQERIDNFSKEQALSYFSRKIDEKYYSLISFDEVNGLTLEEVRNSLRTGKYVAIATVVVTNERFIESNMACRVPSYAFLDIVVFDTEITSDMEIGKVMEKHIETGYADFSEKQKRIYHSFLEKYQCNGYEDVKTKIKSIKQNRK